MRAPRRLALAGLVCLSLTITACGSRRPLSDFEAAQRLGLKAIWGRGLGSRAPVTVGGSQWGGIRARIEAILREEGA